MRRGLGDMRDKINQTSFVGVTKRELFSIVKIKHCLSVMCLAHPS